MTTDKAIYDFLKVNLILFLTDDNILSKIDEDNYAKFSLDKKFINAKCIDILLCNLNNLINNNNNFKLKIDNNLFNNPKLLKIFNLDKIDKEKIKSFFRYSIIQRNYLNFYNNANENFTVSIDKLDYDEDKI